MSRRDPLKDRVRCSICGWTGLRKDVLTRNGRAQDCPRCQRPALETVGLTAAESARRNGLKGGRPKGSGQGRQPRPQIRVSTTGLEWLETVKERECLPSIAATVDFLAQNDMATG